MAQLTELEFLLHLKSGTVKTNRYACFFLEDLDRCQCSGSFIVDDRIYGQITIGDEFSYGERRGQIQTLDLNDEGVSFGGNLDFPLDEYKKEIRVYKGEKLSTWLTGKGFKVRAFGDDTAKRDYCYFGKSIKYFVRNFCYQNDLFYIWENGVIVLATKRDKTSKIEKIKNSKKERAIEKKSNQVRPISDVDNWLLDVVKVKIGNYSLLQNVTGDATGTIIKIMTKATSVDGKYQKIYVRV